MAPIVVIIPQEIMEDIFSRLTVKSLERFRCLSKSCNLLISKDQSFARMQLNRALQSPNSSSHKILLSSRLPPYLRSLDYEKEHCFADESAISRLVFPANNDLPLRVVGSCHGLLCVTFNNSNDVIYLWNPSTGDYNKLPDHPCLPPDKPPSLRTTILHHSYKFIDGFGYDSLSDDYKVLLGLKSSWLILPPNRHIEIEKQVKFAIFSLRENCWRIIQQLPPIRLVKGLSLEIFGSYFVNGNLNWLVLNNGEVNGSAVVAFDLNTEMFLELPLPHIDTPCVCSGFGVLQGRLCLSIVARRFSSNVIELWVMNECGVGQSWTRLLNYPYKPEYMSHFPLCISKDNQIIILANGRNRLTRFDVAKRQFEEFNLCKSENHDYSFGQTVIYLESLVSPNVDKQKSD